MHCNGLSLEKIESRLKENEENISKFNDHRDCSDIVSVIF